MFMAEAAEVVTGNGISYVAATFFTGLFAMLGIVAKGVFDARSQAKQAKVQATKAAVSADQAQTNTENSTNVSDGFARSVVGKLDGIHAEVHDIGTALREHLEWHLNKETPGKD